MVQATPAYVEQTADGDYRLFGTRVTLDSVVHGYWNGQTPEAIAEDFPTLSLEQVYGAIAFYLHNRSEVEVYLRQQADRWEQIRVSSETENAAMLSRLREQRSLTRP